jgi:hypothetical protein
MPSTQGLPLYIKPLEAGLFENWRKVMPGIPPKQPRRVDLLELVLGESNGSRLLGFYNGATFLVEQGGMGGPASSGIGLSPSCYSTGVSHPTMPFLSGLPFYFLEYFGALTMLNKFPQ